MCESETCLSIGIKFISVIVYLLSQNLNNDSIYFDRFVSVRLSSSFPLSAPLCLSISLPPSLPLSLSLYLSILSLDIRKACSVIDLSLGSIVLQIKNETVNQKASRQENFRQ
jgi:hypothetical protein